jgi:hypothetical protein
VVLMEFPDMAKAKEWYEPADYQKILPRRTTHSISDLILVDGVGPGFTTAGFAQRIGVATAGTTGNGNHRASTVSASTQGDAEGNRRIRGSVGSRVVSWPGDTVVPDKRPICSCCRSPNGYGHGPPLPTTTE